ncbi:hypothetical protein QF000_001502 [Paraburkholderia atlantica]
MGEEPSCESNRGDGERKAKSLHELVFLKTQSLRIRHGGNREDAGGTGQQPGNHADDGRKPGLAPLRDRKCRQEQRIGRIGDQGESQQGVGVAIIPLAVARCL